MPEKKVKYNYGDVEQFFKENVEQKVGEGNLLFNKKINLIYGKFLRMLIHETHMKILAYTQPFDVVKVDYAKIVDDLQKAWISDDVHEDKGCKKPLPMSISGYWKSQKKKTSQRSHIFNSLKEACFHQHLYGVKIYSIGHEEEGLWWEDEGGGTKLWEKLLKEGKTYYILNISDKATLDNGFRYIKELLLQYHNYARYEAYEAMKSENVRVYSVKSDAFTVHPNDIHLIKGHEIRHHRKMASYYDLDLEEFTLVNGIWYCKNVEGILNVGTEIGQWKIENKTVKLPCDLYI